MTKNLLIITQRVDKDAELLGFFVDWIKEFAFHFDKVFVITLERGVYELPPNVFIYSLGKEKNTTRFFRFLKFYFFLFKLVPRSSGLFAHMSPIFAIASWPVAFIFNKKIILWYLHRSVTFRLKLAEKICYRVITAAKESLNIKSKKIVEVGHGINIRKFEFKRDWLGGMEKLNILSIGRITRIKNYETLFKAAKILKEKGIDFKITAIGRPVMKPDFSYSDEIKALVNDLKLGSQIEFIDFVPYSRLPEYFKKANLFINMAPTGGIDKVVLEAMASGSLVLVSNTAFRKYFGEYDLFFRASDANDLAGKIIKLIEMPVQGIENMSAFLVQSVKKHHDLKNTINKITNLFN